MYLFLVIPLFVYISETSTYKSVCLCNINAMIFFRLVNSDISIDPFFLLRSQPLEERQVFDRSDSTTLNGKMKICRLCAVIKTLVGSVM